jgi:hypothetical protein
MIIIMPANKQIPGWSPTSDDDIVQLPFDKSSPPTPPLSPLSPLSPLYPLYRHLDPAAQSPVSVSSSQISSRRASFDSSYSASSDRRIQRNLERDPSWIPRPRNAFILFRCDYSRQHARSKDGGCSGSDTFAGETLSARAGKAWRRLTEPERERYRALAELEKEKHARDNPEYRFRPVKRATPTRRGVRPRPEARRNRASTADILEHDYADDNGVDLRRWEARRFTESLFGPNDPPLVPDKAEKSAKSARRRSSSVPMLGMESGQYPWLTPEAQSHLPLK